ncbi:MAG TPA: cysteine hydrolase family protein [Allosphingosinicella sp.]|uniref:cysteine hydrolase family protein n=1 Tax=Allosphingosinicella sp. TaxID=2823234 RepID=UPI002ED88E94
MTIDGNTALILIDVQQGFDDAHFWGRRNNPDAERNVAKLLESWRGAGRPVFHVRHDSVHENSPLHPDSPGNRIKPEAAPLDGEPIYPKSVNSAFIGTTLEQDLRAQGISRVVIAGLTTNHCVSTTTRMAGNLGFETFLVSDATATFERLGLDGKMRPAEEVHASALSDLHGEFATVVTTAEAVRG